MPEAIDDVLAGATQSALETTAFLIAEPGAQAADADADADADAAVPPPPFVATVAFEGARSGAFRIEFPARILPVLAANVLGEDESPSEETQRDALGELANIICGNVLPAFDPGGRYSLAPPAVVKGPPVALDAGAVCVASADLQVDGERVGASFWLRDAGVAARSA